MRWGVEIKYNKIKKQLKLQHFSGTKVIEIKQDFLSTIIMCNIASYFKACVDKEIDIENANKNKKYKEKANKNVLLGTIKSKIDSILLREKSFLKKIEAIISTCKRSRSPIRTNRKNERNHRTIKPRFYVTKKTAI